MFGSLTSVYIYGAFLYKVYFVRLFIWAFFHKVFVFIYSRSLSLLSPFYFFLFGKYCVFLSPVLWLLAVYLRCCVTTSSMCSPILWLLGGIPARWFFSCEEHNKRTFICIYQKLLLPLHPKTMNNDVRRVCSTTKASARRAIRRHLLYWEPTGRSVCPWSLNHHTTSTLLSY